MIDELIDTPLAQKVLDAFDEQEIDSAKVFGTLGACLIHIAANKLRLTENQFERYLTFLNRKYPYFCFEKKYSILVRSLEDLTGDSKDGYGHLRMYDDKDDD